MWLQKEKYYDISAMASRGWTGKARVIFFSQAKILMLDSLNFTIGYDWSSKLWFHYI